MGPHCLPLYLNLSMMLAIFAADGFGRHHFSDSFFVGALRVKAK